MSEMQLKSFLNKTLGFFMNFLILIFMYMISMEFAIFYVMKQEMNFYYVSIGVFGFALVYTLEMFKRFQHFHDLFEQNTSNSKTKMELDKPLNVEVEELPLKACLLYRNGLSFKQVTQRLRLGREAQTSIRLVRKGLDILLKEHKEVQPK